MRMDTLVNRLIIAYFLFAGCSTALASWPTFGGDVQRNSWAKNETLLSPTSVKNLQLLWKLKLDNEPKELTSLTTPVVVNPVYTDHGAETYVVVAGSSDNLYLIDSDTGKLVWKKHFTDTAPSYKQGEDSGSYFCPAALNDTPVIGSGRLGVTVYVISIDGRLHALNIVNGKDRFPAKQFVPPYSKNWSLNLVNDVIYTSTSQGCGKAKSGVWAFDLSNPDAKPVFFASDPTGGGVWGRGGVSVGSSGTVFAETGDGPVAPEKGEFGDAFVALSPKTLKVLDYFIPENANYITRKDLDMGNDTPVVFSYKGRELLVGSGKEGKLFLLDAKSLGGKTHRKPLYVSPRYTNQGADIAGNGFWGAYATWKGAKGERWIYAPAWGPLASDVAAFPVTNGAASNGSIMAFRVEEKNGSPVLAPAWMSRDMSVPEPPAVANGVVFALSSGGFTRQVKPSGQLYSTQERIAHRTGNAVLYAFDAATGKELYSSEKIMPSFTHLGGLAVSDGRVYVSTYDGTVYAFGLKGE
jgi:outer membrane protein assembly factor BamB